MANKQSEITPINLKTANVNLDDEQIEITNYEGFNKKNSYYIGGQLKNWYYKAFQLPDYAPVGSKIIYQNGQHLYWQDGAGHIYEDNIIIYEDSNKYHYVKETVSGWIFVDYITDINYSNVKFRQTNDYTYEFNFTYDNEERDAFIITDSAYSIAVTVGVLPELGSSNYLLVALYKADGTYDVKYFDTSLLEFRSITTAYRVVGNYVVKAPTVSSATRTNADCVAIESETSTTYALACVDKEGAKSISKTHGAYYGRESESKASSTSVGWTRGKKIVTYAEIGGHKTFVLYYNLYQTGISINGSVVVDNIDHVVFVASDSIYYVDSEGNLVKLYAEIDGDDSTFYFDCLPIVKNRYLLLNTTSYMNTIDLNTGKSFPRSCDYNDRLLIATGTGSTMKPIASAVNEQVEVLSDVYCSTVYPWTYIKTDLTTLTSSDIQNIWPDDEIDNVQVNFYLGSSVGETPEYIMSELVQTDGTSTTLKSGKLIGMTYPMNDSPLYCVPATATFMETYLNYCLVNNGSFSFLTQTDQYQNMLFAYYITSYINLQGLFVMQGTIYGVTENGYIIAMTVSDNTIQDTKVVCNKGDFQYIGCTPTMAFLRSSMDRSIYAFTGDQTLTKLYDCNNVSDIYSYYNNASSGVVALNTNIGIIGLYDGQIAVIEGLGNNSIPIYYADDCFIVDNNYMFSPYKKEGFLPYPVILETKFYGVGSEVKSVNDCVYIRLYSENNEANGQVKVWCETMNDKCQKSKEKIFYMNKSMFDYNGMAYIRYQPALQSGTGFRVHIESDFSIVSISIGHRPETVQNSSINL